MQNSIEYAKEIKKRLRKHRFLCAILVVCFVLTCIVASLTVDLPIFLVLAIAVLFISRVCSVIVFRKVIGSALTEDLDADAYRALIYQGKLDTEAAVRQIEAEYFGGNYQNVIYLCRSKLVDPKFARKCKYYYLAYLANVFFDIGDDENLRLTCEQFRMSLAAEKPGKQAKIRKQSPRMEFFETYLDRNLDSCLEMISSPAPTPLDQYRRTFYKARLALLQDKEEEARECCGNVVKAAPKLTYGRLAAKMLEKMDSQEESCDALRLAEVAEAPIYILGDAFQPVGRRVAVSVITVVIMLVLYAIILGVWGVIQFMASVDDFEKGQEAYRESIRVLVEEDYDGVEILDTFTLEKGEDDVDSMFLCKTDTRIVVGCVYKYKGESTRYYEDQANFPITYLSQDGSPLWRGSFFAVTSDYKITCCFYKDIEEVPDEYYYLYSFKIGERIIYFVVTEITPYKDTPAQPLRLADSSLLAYSA